MTNDEAKEPDLSIWLNAFRCVRPTDQFAAELGHDIIKELKASNNLPGEITVRVRAN